MTAVLAKNQTGSRYDSPNRITFEVASEWAEEISRHKLMWKIGCARHEEFSFDHLIAIAVLGHRVEVINSHERFDSGSHKETPKR
jgi:hypothetical protein